MGSGSWALSRLCCVDVCFLYLAHSDDVYVELWRCLLFHDACPAPDVCLGFFNRLTDICMFGVTRFFMLHSKVGSSVKMTFEISSALSLCHSAV